MVMALRYDLTRQEVLIYQEDKESEVMANLGKSAGRESFTGYSGGRPRSDHSHADRGREFYYLLFHHGQHHSALVKVGGYSPVINKAVTTYRALQRSHRLKIATVGTTDSGVLCHPDQSGLAAL